MFKKLIFLFSVSVLLASCGKTSTSVGGCTYTESAVVAPTTEIATLQAWITANHPTAIKHPSGFFYEILSPGTGLTANVCSHIIIKYSGWLIFTSPLFKFDENLSGATFALGQLIIGWQKGIPLVQPGGSINLYIPPTLGYGSSATGIIPANSYLYFHIDLVAVQ